MWGLILGRVEAFWVDILRDLLFFKAVRLLKPNGYLVYSTCTITIEENEQQVSWLLRKFDQELKLVDQVSHLGLMKLVESLLANLFLPPRSRSTTREAKL